ncbi:MAG: hypothetical protein Q7T40_09925 [Methylobacter sp.]|nr:hypothetical protein [Methylobacter sp.]
MSKKILGLDLGSNSIGWASLEESNGQPDFHQSSGRKNTVALTSGVKCNQL